MSELKAVLFEAYDGFADKRVKNLDKSSTFLVDDRDPGVIGAHKKPLSWFCQIYAHAIADDELRATLTNTPLSEKNREMGGEERRDREARNHADPRRPRSSTHCRFTTLVRSRSP